MPAELIYWDSMCFIHRLSELPEHIAVLRSVTDAARQGKVVLVTSAFTLCEVAKVGTDLASAQQEQLISDFFENPYIRIMAVDRFVANKAREILRLFPGVRGKDAVHIATACLTPRLKVMHTYEAKLINKTGRLPGCSITIMKPETYDGGQTSADDEWKD